MKVELIYDLDCPNVSAMRKQLLKAFSSAKLAPKWTEWDRNSNDTPSYAKQFGSPTILVDEQDIAACKPSGNNCCRLYKDSNNQLQKTPEFSLILSAFKQASKSLKTNGRRYSLEEFVSTIPVIFLALLPKLTCPLCWPAYTAILSSLGISFLNYTPMLLPLMMIFLIITLFLLAFRAKRRQGYRPFILGLVAGLIIVTGKFIFHYDLALYTGVLILVIASIWNSWPVKKSCAACK